MEKKTEISGTFLRQSISEMKKIHSRPYTESKHGKKSFLEEKADQYFDLFMENKLDIKEDDMKTFSQYVDLYAIGGRKEKLLDKIQRSADFDVREFLYEDSKTWWQKLWNKEKYSISATGMNRRVLKYIKARQKLEDSGYYSGSSARLADKLREEAETLIEAYNDGHFSPKPEDMHAFSRYVKTMGSFYEGSPAETAFKKLEAEKKDIIRPTPKPRKKFSWGLSFKKVKYALGGVALTAVMGLGAWFGFGGNNKKQDTPKGKQPVVNIITKLTTPKMAMPAAFDYSLDKFIKTENVNTTPSVQISESAGEDFYESRLNRFLSKSKKESLKIILSEQIQKGIISLPQSISPSRFLYVKTIYQKYGLNDVANEFNQALNADKKLSAENQAKLYDYVNKAGAKGLGARDMAYKQHYGKQTKSQKNLAQVIRENRIKAR